MLVRFSFLTLICSFFFTTMAMAEKRVALIIGNSNYKNTISLLNPAMDAKEIAKLLHAADFQIITGTDLSHQQMTTKLSEFAGIARNADVALFFYAGHGIQLNTQNFLIPVDADLKSEMDAEFKAIKTSLILHTAMAGAKAKIMLLDACRDNPFVQTIARSLPRTRSTAVAAGLAEMSTGEGTLIAFATSPGQVALDGENSKNSPFTGALLKYLAKPGLEIDHALKFVGAEVQNLTGKKQQPWVTTNMTKLLYINKSKKPTVVASLVSPIKPATPSQARAATGQNTFDPRQLEAAKLRQETAIWQAAQGSNTVADYQQYLSMYPTGSFAGFAKSRMAALANPTPPARTRTVSPPPPYVPAQPASITPNVINPVLRTAKSTEATEDALGLQRVSWRSIQRRLTNLGFRTRGTNGSVGRGTRRAIRNWQTRRGYAISGFLNKLQHEALLLEQPLNVTPKRGTKRRTKRRIAKKGSNRKLRNKKRKKYRKQRNYSGPNPRQIRKLYRTGKRLGLF